MKKREQMRRAQIIAELQYAKERKDLILGLKISQMITILALHDKFGWEPEELRAFYDAYKEFFAAYHFGDIDREALEKIIDEIKTDMGIDLLEPVVIREEDRNVINS